MGTVTTVGYEGLSFDALLDTLRSLGVTVLVDVRLTPLSRRPGMSRRALSAGLAEAGVAYRHYPALGNPRENREPLRRGDPSALALYRDHLDEPDARVALAEIAALARTERVALLCVEADPARCHRTLVAERLGI